MESQVALREFLQVKERPYDNSIKHATKGTEESSISNTLGSTLLSLSLNNSEQSPQNQEQPMTQLSLLQIKLDEVKKENQNLRSMVNQISTHYAALQNKLMLAIQQQQQQLSSSPRNNHDLKKDSRQDGRNNLTYAYNIAERKINNQIQSQEAKIIDDQASEVSCRKARVSIRARSDFSLMGDGCQWRKYGQKTSKGNPCPRAYYRCSMGTACPVRKQVQRCAVDETVLISTYEGNHNHPLPPEATSIATTTSAALNMFLSGSTISSFRGSTLSNSSLFTTVSNSASTGLAMFSPSASCPTVTLDLAQPSNDNLKFQGTISSNHRQPFPSPFHGCSQQQSVGLHLSSRIPSMIPEKNLALVDLVSAAITKDPSFKAALVAAVSSPTEHNNSTQSINNHSQKSDPDDPSSKMPAAEYCINPAAPLINQLI